jgi:hypothetical protein
MNSRDVSQRVIACFVVGIAMFGVATASGCGRSTKVEARTTTLGQELTDLEAARNKGLLTEEEYSRKRQEIMKRK